MTNSIALGLGLAILAAIVADQVWLDGAGFIFLMRRFYALIEWLAFWR
ncbi:MAG: glyceraldehyde-3-phosphate dehydrogenase [Rhodosalinus sp.]